MACFNEHVRSIYKAGNSLDFIQIHTHDYVVLCARTRWFYSATRAYHYIVLLVRCLIYTSVQAHDSMARYIRTIYTNAHTHDFISLNVRTILYYGACVWNLDNNCSVTHMRNSIELFRVVYSDILAIAAPSLKRTDYRAALQWDCRISVDFL